MFSIVGFLLRRLLVNGGTNIDAIGIQNVGAMMISSLFDGFHWCFGNFLYIIGTYLIP